MSSLSNKRVLLGITGGIAAYKSAELVRGLSAQGADVRVVMTAAAQSFITPLTLQALSGNPVNTELMSLEAEAAMGHIELARWADVLLVAPCTADFMAKLTRGEASDLLSTLYLACQAPALIAPAMNQAMWAAEATQVNIATLRARGVIVIGPASGEQACGDVGLGRMEEPDTIVQACAGLFESGALAGKRIVITAGPTREAIDPVRYISNHSSGKMGYALANAAADAGANVTLISGPVNLAAPDNVKVVPVTTALDMHAAALREAEGANIFVAAAAVADYRVAEVAEQKLKKSGAAGEPIHLIENPDIIKDVAERFPNVFAVGFAAETQNVVQYARQKLKDKHIHLIIANDVSDARIGFNSSDNAVTVISANDEQHLTIQNKTALAIKLVDIIADAEGKGTT